MGWPARTLLLAVALSACACDGEGENGARGVTLTWMSPTEFEDGSALSPESLTEYRIYVGDRMVATVEPDRTEYFLELPQGEWDVSISAVAGGVESLHMESTRVTIH